jgi:hypothetical protein
MSKKPSISKITLIINEIVEIGNRIKLLRTIASADPLPTAARLGIIKKNIAAAAINAPNVIMTKSIIADFILIFLLNILFFL